MNLLILYLRYRTMNLSVFIYVWIYTLYNTVNIVYCCGIRIVAYKNLFVKAFLYKFIQKSHSILITNSRLTRFKTSYLPKKTVFFNCFNSLYIQSSLKFDSKELSTQGTNEQIQSSVQWDLPFQNRGGDITNVV